MSQETYQLKVNEHTEQSSFIAMLKNCNVPHMLVQDMQDPQLLTVSIENKMVNRDMRVDVVFQFRNAALDRVWVREG